MSGNLNKAMNFSLDYFDRPKLFYFWKGRVALYTILKAMDIQPGDEVILPGFTCVVVANAIIYTGAKPVYADVDPQTYNVTAETIAEQVTDRTRAIIVQNTFGLSPDLDPIISLAGEHGLYLIEDCAHGLGATYKGRPAGTNTHAAFFSTQWSKPISTGIGGVAYVQDDELAHKVGELVATLPQPSLREQFLLWAQLVVRPLADMPALYYTLISLYRLLTQRIGLPVGSSIGEELQGTTMPPGYLQAMSPLQHRRWPVLLAQLPQKVKARQKVAQEYDKWMTSFGLQVPYRPDYAEHGMLRYPVRVQNKSEILQRAVRMHIPIGDWFVSPLHPVEGDLLPWGYRAGQCPQAELACAEVINLFTDRPLTPKQMAALFG